MFYNMCLLPRQKNSSDRKIEDTALDKAEESRNMHNTVPPYTVPPGLKLESDMD